MAINDLDELPIIRPDLKGRAVNDRVATFSRSVLNRSGLGALKKGSSRKGATNRGGHPARGKSASATRLPGRLDRRVLIKARVVKMSLSAQKSMNLHVNYIERDGVEKDGSKGNLYGKEYSFDRNEFLKKIDSENHQFRFIISPEDAHDLDMTEYIRELMNRFESDLGRQVDWAAVNHYNTDNPHTHVVVRGVALDGKELRIDRQYISNGFRNRACELSTQWLGQKTVMELEEQLTLEVKKERFTSLDHQIEKFITISNDQLTFDLQKSKEMFSSWVSEKQIHSRLDALEKIGLANKDGHLKWVLQTDWKKTLKEMGERGDIIKEMHRKLGGDTGRYRLYDKYVDQPLALEGRVVDKGLSDELYDKQYIVIESASGKAWHVDLDFHLSVTDYQVGDVVSLKVEVDSWLKPSDQNIERIASRLGGIYRPQDHAAQIGQDVMDINGIKISKADFVQAHVKRLQRLTRFELATELDDGSWRVKDSLVAELMDRDQRQTQRKIIIQTESKLTLEQQLNYVGRTWLDRFTDDASLSSCATHGFGAQIRQASVARAQFLQTLGIDPSDKSRARALDRAQLRSVSSYQEKLTGRKAIELHLSKPMQGVLIELPVELNGKRFSRIDSLDGQSFALVPWHRSHEKSMNKQVTAGLTSEGRVWVKGQSLDRGLRPGR